MDEHLVERARNGDDVAFTDLIDLHGDRCYAIAYRILRDTERARDAVQQAWLLAWHRLPTLRDVDRFEVWLHRLLINACYEDYRRHRRWTEHVRAIPSNAPGGSDSAVTVGQRDALERAFRTLSPEHRAVVVLHHHVGMPLATVAEVVGVPVGTVKSRLHYGIQALREALRADDAADLREVRPA